MEDFKMCEHHNDRTINRRQALTGGVTLAAAAVSATAVSAQTTEDPYADPANPALPPSNMELDLSRTALVVTDPQIDFLHPEGVTWGVVGASVTRNGTVANIENLFKAAKQRDITVAVSPHYYYPTDHGWKFEGALEKLMHKIGMFDRKGPLVLDGFESSGADWMPEYKQYIDDGKTIVTSPHKMYGNDSNDLTLQLRKNGVDQVILAGMSANLCTESHMRELLENGFEVAVVKDATAAAMLLQQRCYLKVMDTSRHSRTFAIWRMPSGRRKRLFKTFRTPARAECWVRYFGARTRHITTTLSYHHSELCLGLCSRTLF
jgi:nicotinamidase-related amidase